MWQPIRKHFKDYPAQEKVAKLLLEVGISVRNNKAYCNEIEVPPIRIASAAGVDRRAVTATISTITKKKQLRQVFSNLKTTAFFKDVATTIGAGLIEIIPTDPAKVGVIAGVTKLIADTGISVRQCVTEDPEFSERAKLYIITEKPVPGKLIPKIKKVPGVSSVVLH